MTLLEIREILFNGSYKNWVSVESLEKWTKTELEKGVSNRDFEMGNKTAPQRIPRIYEVHNFANKLLEELK